MPEVVKEVRRLLASSAGLWQPAQPLSSFCVEISLKTAEGAALVLEQWALTLDTAAQSGARPTAAIVNQLGQSPPAHRALLSRQWLGHII